MLSNPKGSDPFCLALLHIELSFIGADQNYLLKYGIRKKEANERRGGGRGEGKFADVNE